jgi:uncharacterized protein YuzB (UPF0349 family)
MANLGDTAARLRSEIERREHFLVEKDCLNRCQGCQLGLLIAVVDGAPMSAKTVEKFLADLAEIEE